LALQISLANSSDNLGVLLKKTYESLGYSGLKHTWILIAIWKRNYMPRTFQLFFYMRYLIIKIFTATNKDLHKKSRG